MARTPLEYAQLMEEPTIIIDPSLFAPPPRTALGLVRDVAFGVARGLVVTMLAGATILSVTHVIKHQTLTHGMHDHHVEPVSAVVVKEQAERQTAEVAFANVAPVAIVEALPSVTTVQTTALAADEEAVDEASTDESLDGSTASIMARVREGRRHLNAKRLVEAEAAFRDVLSVRKGHPAALAGLAKVYLVKGRLDEALGFAQRAVQAAPYQAAYHLQLGDVLRASGRSSEAQAEYDLAAQRRPQKLASTDALPPNPFQ